MSLFTVFADAVARRWAEMQKHELFVTNIDPDGLWNSYLSAFPAGTNEIFRERTEHDGSYDRSFIKRVGNVVAITPSGEVLNLWDDLDTLPYPYNVVADALAQIVASHSITGLFRSKEPNAGHLPNIEMIDGKYHTWNHFYVALGKAYDRNAAMTVGAINTNVGVMKRSLEEITPEAVNTVLELISQGNLYRGDEFKNSLTVFKHAQALYLKNGQDRRNVILWLNCRNNVLLIKNSVIGSLLMDLSEGVDLEAAVGAFEAKVAPTNYKRPSALVTAAMINKAMEKIEAEGLTDALDRRHAVLADLSINDVLWADASAKNVMKDSPLKDKLMLSARPHTPTNLKAQLISIDDFMTKVLPVSSSVEVLLSNSLRPNMVSITAPVHDDAAKLFKWDNGFAWSYNGGVTDAIKERVKKAGGDVNADLRVSLAWFNGDDLDLHSEGPHGHVYFGSRSGDYVSYRILDVDMNVSDLNRVDPVENQSFIKPKDGNYKFYVHNYRKRENERGGFEIQVEGKGISMTISHTDFLAESRRVEVCTFTVKNGEVVNFKTPLQNVHRSQEIWGLTSESFVRVKTALLSPNHWGDQAVGNKHFFFLLEGAINPEETRGVYNEYLRSDLEQHRKVFELVGAKTKIEPNEDASRQLSGVGFSSTVRKTATFKADNRLYEVQF